MNGFYPDSNVNVAQLFTIGLCHTEMYRLDNLVIVTVAS